MVCLVNSAEIIFEPHPPDPYGHDISCPYNNVEKGEKTCFSGGFVGTRLIASVHPSPFGEGCRGEVAFRINYETDH